MSSLGSKDPHPDHWLIAGAETTGIFECRICSVRAVSKELLNEVPCQVDNRREKVKQLVETERKKRELLSRIREEEHRLTYLMLQKARQPRASLPSPATSPTGGVTSPGERPTGTSLSYVVDGKITCHIVGLLNAKKCFQSA